MSNRSARNQHMRRLNTPEVIQFCEDNGFDYRWINGDWHLRIENVIDIYPGRKRYFWLPTEGWGYYKDYEDLGRIMMEKMEGEK